MPGASASSAAAATGHTAQVKRVMNCMRRRRARTRAVWSVRSRSLETPVQVEPIVPRMTSSVRGRARVSSIHGMLTVLGPAANQNSRAAGAGSPAAGIDWQCVSLTPAAGAATFQG